MRSSARTVEPELVQGQLVDVEYYRKLPGTKLERKALRTLERANLRPPVREMGFHPYREWRLDFAWPDELVAVEVQGGTWARGKMGHATGSGLERDYVKTAEAQLLGWIVIQVNDHMISDGRMVEYVRRALEVRAQPSK